MNDMRQSIGRLIIAALLFIAFLTPEGAHAQDRDAALAAIASGNYDRVRQGWISSR